MTALTSFLTLGLVVIGMAIGAVAGFFFESSSPTPTKVIYCTRDARRCAPSVELLTHDVLSAAAASANAGAPAVSLRD